MKKGVSKTQKEDGKWQKPRPIEIEDYYNDNVFGEYCLSVSGKILVSTLQRNDAIGNKDIYVSFLKDDESWTKPLNLGATLNTAESEVSPFLAADETTLYFSNLNAYWKII